MSLTPRDPSLGPFGPDGPGDERLSAWLDGELHAPEHAAERQAIEAWLKDHPDAAARVRLWAADAEALRMRLAPLLDEPVPEALRRRVAQPPGAGPRTRWAQAAAAAGLLLAGGVLGALGSWQWQQRGTTS